MQPLQLLVTLRTIANDTELACKRQEFKPEFIYKNHNEKLANLQKSISNNNSLNTKQKAKLNLEIKKIILAPVKTKNYDVIQSEVKAGVNRLTSAMDFMKR